MLFGDYFRHAMDIFSKPKFVNTDNHFEKFSQFFHVVLNIFERSQP